MATGYTQHYGLCQWAGEDKFLREEFNGDNRRVDEALGRVARGLEDTVYNVYNLTLQHYYEGKETGWKRALLFDGFLNQERVASADASLVFQPGGYHLSARAQPQFDLGYDTGRRANTMLSTEELTVTGNGLLTGCQVRIYNGGSASVLPIPYTITRSGATVQTGTLSTAVSTYEDVLRELVFPQAVPLAAGNTLKLTLTVPEHCSIYRRADSATYLGGILYVTPRNGQSGRLVSTATPLPEALGARAWVRHSGGAVALSLRGGGTDMALHPVGTRQTVNATGQNCIETSFLLEEQRTAGSTAVVLNLTLSGGGGMTVFDYGLMLL